MKKLVYAVLFTCSYTSAFAQFHLGLSAGANTSFWKWALKSPDFSFDYQPATGWRGVVMGEWQMKPMWGLRTELGVQTKANKMVKNLLFESDILAGNFGGTEWKFRENYQFWEGSLLLQFAPVRKFPQLYLLAGGTGSRLTKAWKSSAGQEAGHPFSSKNTIDLSDPNWNRNYLVADFGMGGNIPLGALSSLKVECRYQYSITELSSNENVDARVNTLLLQLGYLHRL